MSQLERVRIAVEGLGEDYAWGPTWSPEELDAFEAEHGCVLPAGYRGFLEHIGDGGPGFGRGLLALRDRDDLADLDKPFALRKGWVTPEIEGELRAEGLLSKYRRYLYELDEGVSPDFGTLPIGLTSDHQTILLVVTGNKPGQLWTDNRGNDFEEVLPTKQGFLDRFEEWLTAELAEIEARRDFRERLERGGVDALRERFDDDELDEQFEDLLGDYRDPDAGPMPVDLARAIAAFYPENYGYAGQALALAGLWEELEAACIRDLDKLAADELKAPWRAEVTLHAHLAVAQVALGRPGEPHEYGTGLGYVDPYSELVPIVLSRWESDDDLIEVFRRLRWDTAVTFLSEFPVASLDSHRALVRRVGESTASMLHSGAIPSHAKISMGSPCSSVGEHLLAALDLDVDRPGAEALLQVWYWIAAQATSTKAYARMVEAARGRFEPLYATREDARTGDPP